MTSVKYVRKWWIPAVLFLMLAAAVTAAKAGVGHDPYEKEVGDYVVSLLLDEPLKTGSSEIGVKIEKDHKAVETAEVIVEIRPAEDHKKESDDHAEEEAEEDSHADEAESSEDSHAKAKKKAKDHADDDGADDHAQEASAVELKAGHEPGVYQGTVKFSQPGAWQVIVHLTNDHQTYEVEYEVDVIPGAGRANLLFSFLGINVAVIAAAGYEKRKRYLARKAFMEHQALSSTDERSI